MQFCYRISLPCSSSHAQASRRKANLPPRQSQRCRPWSKQGWQTPCRCFMLHTSLLSSEMICSLGRLALAGSHPSGSLQHALTANSELFIQLIPVTRRAVSEQDSKQNVFSGAGQVPVSLCYVISVFLAKSSQKPPKLHKSLSLLSLSIPEPKFF